MKEKIQTNNPEKRKTESASRVRGAIAGLAMSGAVVLPVGIAATGGSSEERQHNAAAATEIMAIEILAAVPIAAAGKVKSTIESRNTQRRA